ncbi:MAG TPA: serine hydrolase [Gemmataceae bacterium]|nr:serine hydrolase [Gemmataceae bacterium]
MRRYAAAVPLALLLTLAPLPAAPAESFDAARVDRVVEDALDAWRVPGVAVAIVRDDRVIYLKGHGIKEVGGQDPVTPDTIFPIASCTKSFTTTAMAMLVDDGKMAWDDPVRKHVPYFHLSDPLADGQVTLRDLVTHRTGVGPHELLWYRAPWSQEEAIRRIGRVKVEYPFRSSFHYQTTMFTTAGHAVAAAAKTSWADFVRRRILEPLGMKHVSFTTAEALKAADHASPHRPGRFGQLEVIPWYKMDVPEPAGSINASARDLAQWVRFQLGDGTFDGKRLVSAANLRETHTPQNIIRLEGVPRAMNPDTLQMSYGMAWVIQDYKGHLEVSHAGLIDGFRAHITLVPADHLGIVLLCNRHQTRMNLALSNTLVDRLLGLAHRDWNAFYQAEVRQEAAEAEARYRAREASRQPDTHPSHDLAAYAGTYEEPAYGTAEVTLEKGGLVWHWSSFTCPLSHFHYDTFTAESDVLGNPRIVFTLGADGEVATMKVVDALNVEFKRVKGKAGEGGR